MTGSISSVAFLSLFFFSLSLSVSNSSRIQVCACRVCLCAINSLVRARKQRDPGVCVEKTSRFFFFEKIFYDDDDVSCVAPSF